MADTSSPKSLRPKPPSLLRGILFLFSKVFFLSISAWFILLAWFLIQYVFINPDVVLNHLQHIINLNNQFIGRDITGIGELSNYDIDIYTQMACVIVGITEIIIARLAIFLLAMPLFALFLMIFATDGLVQREIRKFQGTRESTLLFHRAKLCVSFSFFVPLFIFLSLPIYIPPMGFLLTQSVMLSVSIWFSMKYFKKYL